MSEDQGQLAAIQQAFEDEDYVALRLIAEAAEAEATDLRARLANVRALPYDEAHIVGGPGHKVRVVRVRDLDHALDGPQDGGDGR